MAPAERSIEPDVMKYEAPANAIISRPVEILIPKDWAAAGPRFAIAADVMSDGRYLGQIAEAVVEMRA